MTFKLTYSHGSIQGAREYQEDSFGMGLNMDMQAGDGVLGDLLVVCDGMGGHIGGSEASNMVNNIFYESFIDHDYDIPDCLSVSLNNANKAIADTVENDPDKDGMGTTIIGSVITDGKLYWISVGDSPLFLMRDDELIRVNKDHSMAPILDKMAAVGEISEEDALTDVTRNQLRSAITGENIEMIDLSFDPMDLQAGDVLLLATDGVETLSNSRIIHVLEESRKTPEKAADNLLEEVEKFQDPYQDNATCIVCYVDEEKTGLLSKLFG